MDPAGKAGPGPGVAPTMGATARAAPTEMEDQTVRRRMLKSKIHRATVTGADLHYVGSVSIDPALLALADILPNEQVAVLDIDNGARFETYAIVGGPGEVCLNGAAARLVSPGDRVIIITYAEYEAAELAGYEPTVVHVDTANRPVPAELAAADPRRYVEVAAGGRVA